LSKTSVLTAEAGVRGKYFKGEMQIMQKTRLSKALSFFLCIVLIAAMALCTTSCNDNKNPVAESSAPPFTVSKNEGNVLGVGAKKFTFTVTGASGKEVNLDSFRKENCW
jgi:hypothetical protein